MSGGHDDRGRRPPTYISQEHEKTSGRIDSFSPHHDRRVGALGAQTAAGGPSHEMSRGALFAEGVGTGVALALLAGAATLAWRPGLVAAWLLGGLQGPLERGERPREWVRRIAPSPPDYLDVCRAAGLQRAAPALMVGARESDAPSAL